jgi:hypothetical protein
VVWREHSSWCLQTKLVALAVAACLISFFKFANYSDKYGMIVRTITRAGSDLIQFLCMVRQPRVGVCVCMCGFHRARAGWDILKPD